MKFTFQILGNHTKTKIMNKDKIMKRLYNFMTKQVGLLEKMKNNIQMWPTYKNDMLEQFNQRLTQMIQVCI